MSSDRPSTSAGCTLWRGDRLLARIVIHLPSHNDEGFAGIIEIIDFDDIAPMVQWRLGVVPHRPRLLDRYPEGRGVSRAPLQPIDATGIEGLPPHQRLELRDRDGQIIPTTSIHIMPDDVVEGSTGPFPDACHAAGLHGRVWILAARRDHTAFPGAPS